MSTDFKFQFNPFNGLEFSDQGTLIPNYLGMPREFSLRKQRGKLTRTRGNLRRSVRNRYLAQGEIRFRRNDLLTYPVCESRKNDVDIVPSLQGKGANNVALRSVTIKKVEKPPITRELSSERVESLKQELIARFEGILTKMSGADLEPQTMHSQELNSLVEEVVKKVIKNRVLKQDQGGMESNAMGVKEGAAVARSRARDAAMQDPNYQAYLRDAPKLRKDLGECVVAYSNGKMVAVGQNRREVMNKIPAEYKNSRILIQEVPDRVIKSHRPFRVRR